MISFLIYLFESGMCLTLLFLVYFLFLRKETYFAFNRIYLVSIVVLSFVLPLLHFNLTLSGSDSFERRVDEMKRVKNYYEYLIALTDPDYKNSFAKPFRKEVSGNFEESGDYSFSERSVNNNSKITEEKIQINKTGFWTQLNWARVLLILYLLGIFFFSGRLILLIWWIRQTIKKYGFTVVNGVNLVKMDEEVPPFSFFRFVFVNSETASHPGFAQILTHEKVHISQRHSYDLLLAHAITIIQWFNPFAWLINSAMKTNHEYIADRNVVKQGYELFDYQSLLLKQIISIRSVELVNNFNLINIKKRIAMMTKIKSGLAAQIKALVVIPAAIFLFFFFAEITVAQETLGFQNKDLSKDLQGFWANHDANAYGKLLNFQGNNLQILEDRDVYREIQIQFPVGPTSFTSESYYKTEISKHANSIKELGVFHTLPLELGKAKLIIFVYKNDKLTVGWSPETASVYKRINASSSLEYFSHVVNEDFVPVVTSYYRIAENPDKNYFVFMNKIGKIFVDGEQVEVSKLAEKIDEIKRKGNPFSASEKIPVIIVDARCEMAYVNVLYRKLREMDELRHMLSVKPLDEKVPEIFFHNVGIPRLLPPKNAKLLEEEEVEKSGMKIIRIDLAKGITPNEATSVFKEEIEKDKKFVVLFSYENETNYNEYFSILDEFYQAIYAKRNKLAKERYNLEYDDLAKAHQKEIRKSFPMVITERNVDLVEN